MFLVGTEELVEINNYAVDDMCALKQELQTKICHKAKFVGFQFHESYSSDRIAELAIIAIRGTSKGSNEIAYNQTLRAVCTVGNAQVEARFR